MKSLILATKYIILNQRRQFILLILAIILSITQASAYIGPATASMIWQITLAALLSAGYLLHIYWDRIKNAIKRRFNRSEEESI